VETIESTEQEIKEHDRLLSMLLPHSLTEPKEAYLEVEDLNEIATCDPPKTKSQVEREQYE